MNPTLPAYAFEVSLKNFNDLVLLNSHKLPVVVEFMSVDSGICMEVEKSLTDLAHDFSGQFIFVKVDVYEQPELKAEYDIQNLPTIKVFKDGNIVRHEVGRMDSDELALMLKEFGIYRASDETRMQAREAHLAGDTMAAINLLTQAIQSDPSNRRVALDMIQVLLDVDAIEPATDLFNRLPDADKESDIGRALVGQLTFKNLALKTSGKTALLAQINADRLDFDAYFDLAICLVAEHDPKGALDALFALHEQSPTYREGAARELIITIVNMLSSTDVELSKQYRQRLGSSVN
ncbi:tetratricopeptide repeat protein [Thiomicrorhabdus aquaedulcis]|uniref:tetratricopeptide repeat protein n=1 Tax=Thiomicrorhabdus aquaedulcis TaxID=2211106 RepID=UPI000FDC3FD1|nr:tetratricopeptide repeat protein [Thiomicrorhabdus aquaedulcis]